MISIVIPVYNSEKYLQKCVFSLVNQNYKDIEIILVDDGSTDLSPEICEDLAKQDSRIKVVHKENGGPGSARNKGIDVATGDYISFVDSDDWVQEDIFTTLLSTAEKYDADFIIGEIAWNYEDGLVKVNKRVDGAMVMESDEAVWRSIDGSNIVPGGPCGKLISRELFKEIRFPEDRFISEDTAIAYRLAHEAKRVVTIDTVVYNVRCVEGSVTRRTYNRNCLGPIKTYLEMVEFFEKNTKYNKYVFRANEYVAGSIFSNTGEAYISHFDEKNEVLKEMKIMAKQLLKDRRKFSVKNMALLTIISVSPRIFGEIYKKTKA